jgi:hypothetical protein
MKSNIASHLLDIMKSKKTGKAKDLDQFYTNPETAKMCINLLHKTLGRTFPNYLEPSAGSGSFSSQPAISLNCISVDLDPKIPDVIHADFLTLTKATLLPRTDTADVCVLGNPPFGKNSSLAVKFFNHSTQFGDVIAFIIPKTFRKVSLQNKLNLNFWLIKDIDLDKNSFIYEDQPFDVPSCFQIWVKKPERRLILKFEESPYVSFVSKAECDFAVRRVGGTAGKSILDVKDCKDHSFYYLKLKTESLSVKEIMALINQIDFSATSSSTAGVKSISKGEFVDALTNKIKDSLL